MSGFYVSDYQAYRSFLDRFYGWPSVLAGGDLDRIHGLAVRIDREAAALASVQRLAGRVRVS